jgi:hypothetical protein
LGKHRSWDDDFLDQASVLTSWLLLTYVIVVQENKFLKFLGFMWNPLSWVMEAAALMAIVLANGQVCSNL